MSQEKKKNHINSTKKKKMELRTGGVWSGCQHPPYFRQGAAALREGVKNQGFLKKKKLASKK